MGLFGSKQPQLGQPKLIHQFIPQTSAQIADDIRRLEDGDLPSQAETRARNAAAGKVPWISNLDINDLYLAEDIGIEPVTLVAGNCTRHARTDTYGRTILDGDNDAWDLMNAFYEAKDTALERMLTEADLAGAHAVINAEHSFHKVDGNTVYFSITGTAVRLRGVNKPKVPLVSPVSGEEFFKLLQRGYVPVGFALGYQWHCMPVGRQTQNQQFSWYNQEIESMTRKMMDVRKEAVVKMAKDAHKFKAACGIVGAQIKVEVEETEILYTNQYTSLMLDGTYYPPDEQGQIEVPAYNVEFFATGCAIAKLAHGRVNKHEISAYLSSI